MLDESWGDEPEIKAQKSLVAALRKTLLTPADVKSALKKGINPIDSSIEKWSRIQAVLAEAKRIETLAALETFIGAKTCALCIRLYKMPGMHPSSMPKMRRYLSK